MINRQKFPSTIFCLITTTSKLSTMYQQFNRRNIHILYFLQNTTRNKNALFISAVFLPRKKKLRVNQHAENQRRKTIVIQCFGRIFSKKKHPSVTKMNRHTIFLHEYPSNIKHLMCKSASQLFNECQYSYHTMAKVC